MNRFSMEMNLQLIDFIEKLTSTLARYYDESLLLETQKVSSSDRFSHRLVVRLLNNNDFRPSSRASPPLLL